MKKWLWIGILGALAVVGTGIGSAPAEVINEYTVLIDTDNNPVTGGDVAVEDQNFNGSFAGVEKILTLAVSPSATPLVTGVTLSSWSNGTFGGPVVINGGDWEVGVGLGDNGGNVVQTVVAIQDILGGPLAGSATWRLAFTSRSFSGGTDVLRTTNGSVGGAPILLVLQGPEAAAVPTAVPTFSDWGIILLCSLFLLIAWKRLRKSPTGRHAALVLCLLATSFGAAVAFVNGPDPADWAGVTPLGVDNPNDSQPADRRAEILTGYAARENNNLAFRIDFDAATLQAFYVDYGDVPGGDGSQALPFDTLLQAQTNSGPGDTIILVSDTDPAGNPAIDTGIILQNNQLLLGQSIDPKVSNNAGPAITLASGSAVKALGVSSSGGSGISGPGISSGALEQVDVAGTTAEGIALNNCTGTFTFADVNISGVLGGMGLLVNGGSAVVTFDPGSSVMQANNASAVSVQGGHTGQLDFGGSINATNGDGLQFNNSNGIYDFGGPATLNGGDAGIDILGGSAGTFTFTDADITNPTGQAVNVDGGSADVTFQPGSSVVQANNASAVNVQGGHTGQLDFGGSINATGGDGLQFSNSNGIYDFGGPVTLNGGDAGIDILGGSAGTFTFTNTDISDPTGIGLNVDGGAADVTFHPGSSVMQTNNTSALNVQGGHSGRIDYDGSVNATNGDGLQFDNAAGIYDFSGPVTLSGGDAGIDILGGAAGTFTFAPGTAITNPSGIAFKIEDFAAGGRVNFEGSITNNNTTLVDITTTAPGSDINFTNSGANFLSGNGGGGIEIIGADGDVDVRIPATITNPAAGFLLTGVSIFGGSGRIEFLDMTVNLPPFNAAVEINSHTGQISFANLGITTNAVGVVGLSVFNVNTLLIVGTGMVNTTGGPAIQLIGADFIDIYFDSVSVTNSQDGFGGGSGITLVDAAAGNFHVIQTAVNGANGVAGIGIDIDDVGATVLLPQVNIDTTTLQGVSVGQLFGNPGTVDIPVGTVANTGGDGVRVNSAAGFNLNNTTFTGIGGFTTNLANSTVSGTGNVAAPFTCNNGGGNTGQIFFNGGADSCP